MTNTQQQAEAFEKLSRLKVGALFMEMGTGKTKVALDLINFKKEKVSYILWICPFALKNEIEQERAKWYPELQLDIIGCESIGSSDRIFMETLGKVERNNTFIVVDESLKIKNAEAKRTERIIKLGRSAKYKLILNGTPIAKNILDLWTQMEFLSPLILNMSFNQFKNTYCEYYLRGKFKGRVRKQVNIPHLISLIEPYIYDCDLEIETEKHFHSVPYDCDLGEYEQFKTELFERLFDIEEEINFYVFTTKLQRWYSTNSNRQKVIDELCNKINDKVIVFVRYLESIPEGCHKITGAENGKQRKDIIEAFRNGEFNILYMTYGCGAYGLNLQFCSNMIFAEQIWDYALRIQAEARIYRIGQGKGVNYYTLNCNGVGLEKLFSRCIGKKTDLLTAVKTEIQETKGGLKAWVKII